MLEYEGTKYHGWQEQANAKTIQGELRKAAEDFFQMRVELGGAGRTDAGVHALAQVAHLKLQQRLRATYRPKEILFGLNDRLPADICLLNVTEAHSNFHARHDAIARSYLYQISTRKTAFAKKYVWWVKDKLDVAAMETSARLLVGRHDFAVFSKADPARPEASTIVAVESAEVTTEGHLILFRITASHFLWNMVRRLVGALVEVGKHNVTVEEFTARLRNETKKEFVLTAPPSGLFLARVTYPQRA
jgi:tRNA pseudouridine38-40 synthase